MSPDQCKPESFAFYLINPTSLVKPTALEQLATELSQFKIAVAVITETWFNASHTAVLVDIDGYVLFRKDRVKKRWRCCYLCPK